MLQLLASVKGVLKLGPVCNDNNVFRLHYKATTALLLVCCLLVTSKQYIGDPIDCIVKGVDPKVMDTYCWIQSTFSVRKKMIDKNIRERMPYPGVATADEEDEIRYHKYYQWVCFTLFFQAMLFYVPHYLWKMWEGGKCQMLLMDLQSPVTPEAKRREQQNRIAEYFRASLHHHNLYAIRFFCCEVLNFVNVMAQIYFTDLFLGYEFTTYGSRVVQFASMDQENRTDPMAMVFPKMTKCTFYKYGGSGTIQRLDGLCLLPINILNEKIYVALWFWFIVLATLTGLALLYRLSLLLVPQMRLQIFMVRARLALPEEVAVVARECQIGDWFILCQMGKNMDPIAFSELITALSERFREDNAAKRSEIINTWAATEAKNNPLAKRKIYSP